jgi:hypothetical protein
MVDSMPGRNGQRKRLGGVGAHAGCWGMFQRTCASSAMMNESSATVEEEGGGGGR